MNFDQFTIEDLRQRGGTKADTATPSFPPADMDYPVAEPIHRYLIEAAQRSDFGYPSVQEAEALPALFAERMRTKFGWDVPLEQRSF